MQQQMQVPQSQIYLQQMVEDPHGIKGLNMVNANSDEVKFLSDIKNILEDIKNSKSTQNPFDLLQ